MGLNWSHGNANEKTFKLISPLRPSPIKKQGPKAAGEEREVSLTPRQTKPHGGGRAGKPTDRLDSGFCPAELIVDDDRGWR